MIKALMIMLVGFSFVRPLNDTSETSETSETIEISESIESIESSEIIEETKETYSIEGKMLVEILDGERCKVTLYDEDMSEKELSYKIEGDILTLMDNEGSMSFKILEDNKLEVIIKNVINISVNNLNYGDVMSDIDEGEVGDVVTLRVAPNILCKVDSVKVNGTTLIKNEDGTYTFVLKEGENKVEVEFVVDNEQLTYIAEQLGNIKNGNWEDIFSVDNLLNFISWMITILLSSGFFVTLIKNKKIKTKTTQEIADMIKKVNETSITETVNKILEKVLGETYYTYLEKTDSIDETMKVLTRCFVLSQENTPESRLAIIQELTNLKTNQNELTDKVKALINSEIAKNNEANEKKKAALKELEEANNNIHVENTSEEDTYGEI